MPKITLEPWRHLLALSVKQPWAELLVKGLKSIEGRTWWPRLQLPQWVAIHAGKSVAKDAPARIWQASGLPYPVAGGPLRALSERLGGFVGLARFVDRHSFGKLSHDVGGLTRAHQHFIDLADKHLCPLEWWHDEMTGLEFDSPVALPQIIPARGQLGFWRPDEETARRILEAARSQE